jgi:hypothetical protein
MEPGKCTKIEGTLVLMMKKNVDALLGGRVSLQLIRAVNADLAG